jgi:hypothetical protein
VNRLVDLELEKLITYTLPEDLTEHSDQPQSSCFWKSALLRTYVEETFEVQGEKYLWASFLNYLGEEREIVLEDTVTGSTSLLKKRTLSFIDVP